MFIPQRPGILDGRQKNHERRADNSQREQTFQDSDQRCRDEPASTMHWLLNSAARSRAHNPARPGTARALDLQRQNPPFDNLAGPNAPHNAAVGMIVLGVVARQSPIEAHQKPDCRNTQHAQCDWTRHKVPTTSLDREDRKGRIKRP